MLDGCGGRGGRFPVVFLPGVVKWTVVLSLRRRLPPTRSHQRHSRMCCFSATIFLKSAKMRRVLQQKGVETIPLLVERRKRRWGMSCRGGEAKMEAKISANSARPHERRDSPPKKRKPRLLPPPLFRHPSISTSSPFRHAAAQKEKGERRWI